MPLELTALGHAAEWVTGASAVRAFLSRVLGPPTDEFAGILSDEVAGWRKELAKRREQRFLRISCKAAQQLAAAEIEPVRIPDYIAVPLLDAGTLVDDETLQDKWASLLANSANAKSTTVVSEVFPRILASLSPRQAKFLDVVFDYSYRRIFIKIEPVGAATIAGHSRMSEQQLFNAVTNSDFRWSGWDDPAEKARTLDHLANSGVMRIEKSVDPESYSVIGAKLFAEAGIKAPPRWNSDSMIKMKSFYELTIVGTEFVTACRPVKKPNSRA